ncbi:hypothetical protein FDH48_gp57 [Arthrobacter phage Jawnski]|uniref:Uncharacterized protein n=1 Tax=Arthrobacter phage Jawnski TaxID=1772327 RepID=A0A0U4ILH5_9CAUD|nr:hypothetical protein FDH48_gp57 [Arthrobacter phage Jawnski]ALY09386.1 hypothetical protein JAWNSKI_57 [Arthrobacter phage Jawnski]
MSRLEGAAERVAEFLQLRAKHLGSDPELIYKINYTELLTDDLLALVEAAHFMRVMLGINASARVEYATTTEEQGTDIIMRTMPLDKAEREIDKWNVVSDDRAYIVQRLVTDWERKA